MLTEISVAELVAAVGDRDRHVDPARVEHFAAVLDQLPPLVAFRTAEGLLLVDGYHRLAAAVRAGRVTVAVELREGTRADAIEFAVDRAARDRGVPREQARAAIERWSQERGRPAGSPPI